MRFRDIKRLGLEGIKRNYLYAILVAFLEGLISVSFWNNAETVVELIKDYCKEESGTIKAMQDVGLISNTDPTLGLEILSSPIFVTISTIVLSMVFITAICGGLTSLASANFFLELVQSPEYTDFSDFTCVYPNFFKATAVYLIVEALTYVGGLLTCGVLRIVFSLVYSQVYNEMAMDPNIGVIEALRNSREKMHGKKLKLFLFGLSFIPWELLNVLTLGLLGTFFYNSYKRAAYASFYLNEVI
ncbi:MAG TPA: DUF975 family protein [Bacillota bacterium]|nr:DUF975 family protein [Bacillota bacterium]HPE38952.1 DUF975 family protein [Bacillota bacterium]